MNELDYYLQINKIKDTIRYKDNPFSWENVSSHCYMLIYICLDLINVYKLNLNKEKIVKLCLYHDIGEIGLEFDLQAHITDADKNIKLEKDNREIALVKHLSEFYNKNELLDFYNEYNNYITPESKFVKFVDKFESMIHMLNHNIEKFDVPYFAAQFGDKYIKQFPEIRPLYKELKDRIKAKFLEAGLTWDSKLDNY